MSKLCDDTEAGKQPGTREKAATLKKLITKRREINEDEAEYRSLLGSYTHTHTHSDFTINQC